MARILAIGNATLDIVNIVDTYPQEDQEVRAAAQQISRGGNVANTLVVLSQLGHQCSWGGTLAEEPDGGLIAADLQEHAIDLDFVQYESRGKVPTSYITLSRDSGSRTIVHYRDLPEYAAEKFAVIDLTAFDWLHFEGRNLPALGEMLRHARKTAPQLPLSLEVEKVRDGIEELFPLVDLLLFSRDYALQQGASDAADFLQQMKQRQLDALLTCTWGKDGSFGLERDGTLHHAAAHAPPTIVDTLGAGDVFNAGMIDQLLRGEPLASALDGANRLAGRKCGQLGLKNLV